MSNFSNGYRQERPFNICIFGPDEGVSGVLFATMRERLQTTNPDTGDGVDSRLGGSAFVRTNGFVALYGARKPGDAALHYEVVNDAMLHDESMDAGAPLPVIDAFIIPFDFTSSTQFARLRDRVIPRALALAKKLGAPEKVLLIVGHRAQIYSMQQGFVPDEMERLVRTSHALWKYGNCGQLDFTGTLTDMVMTELMLIHMRDFFRKRQSSQPTEASPLLYSAQRTALTVSMQAGPWLSGVLTSLQTRLLPLCNPAPREPRDHIGTGLTAEERQLHSVQNPEEVGKWVNE